MIFERINKVQSLLEKRFLEDCATAGLLVEPQFKVEMIHADFGIPGTNVVIECDSKQWHSSDISSKNDGERNEIYARNGYAVVRIFGSQIMKRGEQIAEEIKIWLIRKNFQPGYVYYPTDSHMIEVRGGLEGLEDGV